MEKVLTFYSPEGAAALEGALANFDGGRLVVNVVDMPIKCPVAPLEFCFLADWYFHERRIRDQVKLTYVTPLDGAFTKPVVSKRLAGMLAEKGVELVTEFNTGEVDGDGGRLIAYDGREVGFDLAVVVPLHGVRRQHRDAGLYACKASVDLFGLEKNDFIDQVQDIITVGEFYERAAGGQIIYK